MYLFGLLGKRKKGFTSPWLQLTVFYAMSRDGLEPEHKFALRGKVLAAQPIQFEISESHTYLLYFPGTDEGLRKAQQLAESLREYAKENALSAFGVGVQQGECLAQMSPGGRLAGKPAGTAIAQAKKLATIEADANADAPDAGASV